MTLTMSIGGTRRRRVWVPEVADPGARVHWRTGNDATTTTRARAFGTRTSSSTSSSTSRSRSTRSVSDYAVSNDSLVFSLSTNLGHDTGSSDSDDSPRSGWQEREQEHGGGWWAARADGGRMTPSFWRDKICDLRGVVLVRGRQQYRVYQDKFARLRSRNPKMSFTLVKFKALFGKKKVEKTNQVSSRGSSGAERSKYASLIALVCIEVLVTLVSRSGSDML